MTHRSIPARHSARAAHPQRISGPDELLQAVPYLLGFHPADSVVVVGLSGGILVVTARLDLADALPADPTVDGLLAHTLARMRDGGAHEVIVAIYATAGTADDDRARGWEHRVTAAADTAGCELLDILLVGPQRWWSLCCEEPDCCDPAGTSLPVVQSPFVAAATLDGVMPLPDRQALVAMLDPLPDRESRRVLVTEAHAAASSSSRRAQRRRVLAASDAAAVEGWQPPGDDVLAELAVALRDVEVRDALWREVDERRTDGRPLWRELMRRMPAPYDAAPALLFGWASWRDGDGALARIAGERAVLSDPGGTAADLLLAALSRGIDPRSFPPLSRPA